MEASGEDPRNQNVAVTAAERSRSPLESMRSTSEVVGGRRMKIRTRKNKIVVYPRSSLEGVSEEIVEKRFNLMFGDAALMYILKQEDCEWSIPPGWFGFHETDHFNDDDDDIEQNTNREASSGNDTQEIGLTVNEGGVIGSRIRSSSSASGTSHGERKFKCVTHPDCMCQYIFRLEGNCIVGTRSGYHNIRPMQFFREHCHLIQHILRICHGRALAR